MNKISLCPFCASSHTFTHDALHNQYAVRCSICNAIGPDMPTIVGAIASWNKRAVQSIESPPLPEPDCGDDFINAFGGYQMHAYAAQAVAAERERCIATLMAMENKCGVDCAYALLALQPVEGVPSNAKKR